MIPIFSIKWVLFIHVKNVRDYTLFARYCPPAIALDFVHFYTQTGDYLGTSEISIVLFAIS